LCKECPEFRELVANSKNRGETIMIRKAIALIATSFVVGTMSTAAMAASKQTVSTADRDVRQLVRLMDKDQNGVVSKEEFMEFMSRTFDRIDADKNGTLEPKELQQTAIPRAVLRDCVHRSFPECSGGN
jgi:Ca2+-binding EF-hand superfamily protein